MSHKISDFPSTTGVLQRLTCPKFVFGRSSTPDAARGAHDVPPGCENETKIKWLYEGETATLGQHQMGNEMKKVGNRWFRPHRQFCATPGEPLLCPASGRLPIRSCVKNSRTGLMSKCVSEVTVRVVRERSSAGVT